MAQVTITALRKQIAEGALEPIYVLLGEDEIGKAEAIDDFVQAVDEGLRAFNVDRFDGSGATSAAVREALVPDLLAAARTLPMMAPRRIVVLQRADALLFPRKGKDDEEAVRTAGPAPRGKKPAAAEDPFEAYVRSPEPTTALVLALETLPQNWRLGKLLLAEAAVVTFGAYVGESEALQWIERQAKAARVRIDGPAARALVARAGASMTRLRSAVERVLLYALGNERITVEDVQMAVPAMAESPEDFGIANAIRRRDAATALRELDLALEAGAVPFYLLGQLRTAAEQLPPASLAEAAEAVLRTDIALKSSGGEGRILLERLIVELAGLAGARRPFR